MTSVVQCAILFNRSGLEWIPQHADDSTTVDID